MCGLFGGYSSVLLPVERDVIQNLMMLNYARGEDSCGIVDFSPDATSKIGKDTSNWRFWKSTDSPLDFARTKWHKAEKDRWSKAPPRLIAGHARAATKGKVCQNNSHPFYHKPVIGMHNGTIYGPFKHYLDHETDSEALIRNIAEMGVKGAIDDLASSHSAAYALVWVDYAKTTLNFLRNDKRPLHFAREKGGSTLFWSSEALQLELALSWVKDGEKFEIMELPINKHYSFDVSRSTFSEPETEEIKPTVKSYPVSYSGAGFQGWTEAEWELYMAERDKKKKEEAKQENIPWEKYPDEDDEPNRVVLGSQEGLSEAYILQYSSKRKEGIYTNWDVATQRWFTVWGWHRLNAVRRTNREKKSTQPSLALEARSSTGATDVSLNDNLPDLMKPGYEEPKEPKPDSDWKDHWETAAPWYVNGEEVNYKDWCTATKNGCTWERCVFIHNTEAIWISDEYVLCEKHAREALTKNSDLNKYFINHAGVIKNGLKGYKRRLLNEIALRSSNPKK